MTAHLDLRKGTGSAADNGTLAVLKALQGLQYGSVEVVFHNGNIVQVERREKVRLQAPGVHT